MKEANSHFFIEPGALSQSSSQCFGPVHGNETTQYRVSNKFTLSQDKMAYAVCKGNVLIVPQEGNSAKVNIVLKPIEQPLPGINIKYFIYRGLKLDDFFVSGNVKPGNSTNFLDNANTAFTNFYSPSTPPAFLSSYIGFYPNSSWNDDKPLSDVFFKVVKVDDSNGTEPAEKAYELPLLNKGNSIGKFSSGECAIDVVIDFGDNYVSNDDSLFEFDMGYARATEALININPPGNSYSAQQKKRLREQISQFVDVASYYGTHAQNSDSKVYYTTSGTTNHYSGTAIYNNLLKATGSDFYTKNRWYIFIQSDRARLYNFYGNYTIQDSTTGESLTIAATKPGLAPAAYSTHEWPVIINNSIQTNGDDFNSLFIQLTTDNGRYSVFYGQLATIIDGVKKNFGNSTNLIQGADQDWNLSKLTTPIHITTPNIDVSGDKYNVACLTYLIYSGADFDHIHGTELDDQNNTVDRILKFNNVGNLFNGFKMRHVVAKNTEVNDCTIVNKRLTTRSHWADRNNIGTSASETVKVYSKITSSTGETFENYTFYYNPVDFLSDQTNTSQNLDNKKNAVVSGGTPLPIIPGMSPDDIFDIITITETNGDFVIPRITSKVGKISKSLILGITIAEYLALKDLIGSDKYNCSFKLSPYVDVGDPSIEQGDNVYTKLRLDMLCETATGELKVFEPTEPIIIYGTSPNGFFSKGYSTQFPKPFIALPEEYFPVKAN